MRVFPLNAHFHLSKCASLRSRRAGKNSVTKNFDSGGKRFGWSDCQKCLESSVSSRVNGLEHQTPKFYAITQTRSHVLSVATPGNAGSPGKTCVRRRSESSRQQTERCAA